MFKSMLVVFFLTVIALVSVASPGVCLAAADQDLLSKSKEMKDSMLSDLETLVNIESPSGYDPGLTKIKDILVPQLRELGADVATYPSPKGGHNIVAVFTGTGKGSVMMMAHADTVFGVGTLAKNPFRIENGKARGPGVADNKGSIVLGLYAIKLIKERDFQDYGKLTFVINCDEEVGSPSSKGLFQQLAKEHDYAICLEAGQPGNGIVGSRKGSAYGLIEVKGRASHAGNAPEKGVNALVELANQVLEFNKLTNYEKQTSVSVTVFQAGDKTNIIPDYAVAKIDIRAMRQDELDRVAKAGAEIEKKKLLPEATVKFTYTPNRPAFPYSDKNQALAERVRSVYRDIGMEMKVESSGGGSDGNWTAFAGTPTIDGMSFIGGNGHTVNEYMDTDSMPTRLYTLTTLLMQLGSQK